LISLLLGYFAAYVRNRSVIDNPAFVVGYALLMTACSFAFFGNQFIRLQFIYVFLVAITVDILRSHRVGLLRYMYRSA
jgi:hypothetical protein